MAENAKVVGREDGPIGLLGKGAEKEHAFSACSFSGEKEERKHGEGEGGGGLKRRGQMLERRRQIEMYRNKSMRKKTLPK